MKTRRFIRRKKLINSFKIERINFHSFSRFRVVSTMFIFWLAVAIFTVSVAGITIQNAIYGTKLNSFVKEIRLVEKENRSLKEEIASKTSLSQIDINSEQNGYSSKVNTLYLSGSDFVAGLH